MLHKQTGSIHNDLMISVICKQKYPTRTASVGKFKNIAPNICANSFR